MRSVMHFYMPSFHASLEQLGRPETAGKPVVITHRSATGEFVVSASLEAKLQGVREGMTARRAGRYCPDGIFLPADWKVYREASGMVFDILSNYSPLLEPQGLDRAYMDVTGCSALFGSLGSIVEEVQRRVKQEVGVPVSVGVARNKLASCAAASVVEVGGCLEVESGAEREFLAPLPVGCLPGVGPKIEKRLLTLGISAVGELASIPESVLIRQLGVIGGRLHRLALGIDHGPVAALYPPESIITEHTFDEEPCEPEALRVYLLRMSDQLSAKLRNRNQKAGKISLRLEFENGEAAVCSYVPKTPVSSTHEIYITTKRILKFEGMRVVSLRLTLSDLRSSGGIQLNFLEDTERRMRLELLLKNVRSRFGERALVFGEALMSA